MRTWVIAALLTLSGAVSAQNVTSCTPGQLCLSIDSTSAGARVPLTSIVGSSAVAIDPATGNVFARSNSGVVQQCTQPSVDPQILTFSSNLSPVNPGTQITLSWSTVNIPTTGTPCTASGGPVEWTSQGALPSSGSRTIAANGAAGTSLTYTISCTASGQTLTRNTSVFLNSTTPPPGCSGSNAPPAGYSLVPEFGTTELNTVFPYGPTGQFPPAQNQRFLNLQRGFSYAYRFTAAQGVNGSGNPVVSGGVNIDEWQGPGQAAGAGTISISQCPHDYSTNLNTPQRTCRSGQSGASSVHALSFDFASSVGSCSLVIGAQYFFNITTGLGTSVGGSPLGYCTTTSCSPLVVWLGATRAAVKAIPAE